MSQKRPAKIKQRHLARKALVYVRQSTPRPVEYHTGSTGRQQGQKEVALRWGWAEKAIEMIDDDLGQSGAGGEHREGWQRLLKLVAQRQVGIILASDRSRLTRSPRDFERLLELCRATDTLLAMDGTISDRNDSATRLREKGARDAGSPDGLSSEGNQIPGGR